MHAELTKKFPNMEHDESNMAHDAKMLDELKADESLLFHAEQVNGALTATRVEPKRRSRREPVESKR